METYQKLEPLISAFITSLRNIGYSFDTAVADIIDNSISASAKNINIYIEKVPEQDQFTLAIVDDGVGMDSQQLNEAMRLGSREPEEDRYCTDLGRFGIGLKTASFSMCRKLTVISKAEGLIAGASWDLDILKERNSWDLILLNNNEVQKTPFFDKLGTEGTLVLWEKIDKIKDKWFNLVIAQLRKHLELTFHRYLEEEPGFKSIKISINKKPLVPFDPYHKSNQATQPLTEEVVNSGACVIKPYILASKSKCSPEEYERFAGDGGYISNQGFYVYRNRRLISHGTWFRLAKKENINQLARVMIDISNENDFDWQVDVKKSRVVPPDYIKIRLKRIIDSIVDKAQKTYSPRLRKINTYSNINNIWNKYLSPEKVDYKINYNHPIIQSFREHLTESQSKNFEAILDILSNELNYQATLDLLTESESNFSKPKPYSSEIESSLIEEAYIIAKELIKNQSKTLEEVIDIFRLLPSFKDFSDELEKTFKQRVNIND